VRIRVGEAKRLFGHNAARFAVRVVVLGAAAGTLGAFSGHALRPSQAVQADATAAIRFHLDEPQVPNRAAKANRLSGAITATLAAAEESTAYSLASVTPTTDFDRSHNAVAAATPANTNSTPPRAEMNPAPDAAAKHAALPAALVPQDKPKRLPPPPPPSALLDDTQIAGIRARLRLTSDQAEYWPAVESALRDVARTQLRADRLKHSHGGKANIDVNSPEVQRLVWAAMPLLMRLREDQKREVRKLARVIGLDSVAAQI
jgi:hypothetical protein